ncbi:MAG: acyl--CoA ligase [Nitrososphaerota archaeon]|nr:acyl--CoA ligase [Nitrososphaerota archaeon]
MPRVESRFRELASFIPRIAEKNRDKTAIIWPESKITYGNLDSMTSKVASAIHRAGVRQGQRVGAFSLNSPEMIYIWLGTLRAGCVFVPYNSALKGDFLAYQVKNSKPSLLFVDSNLLEQVPREGFAGVRIINTNDSERTMDSFIESGEEDYAPAEVRPDSPAEILYTSGTTGSPKGVVLSHFSFVNRANEVAQIVDLMPTDITYNVLPLFHTSGQVMTTLPALLNGLSVIEDRWFHASRYWKLGAENGATVSFLLMRTVNTLLQRDDYTPNNLRVIMCGGVKKETLQQFENRFHVRLLEGFGMTETCGIAIFNTINDNRVGSIGKPLPSVDAKIAGKVGAGIKGELLIRAKVDHSLLEEYFGLPREGLRPGGWFATGDLACFDEDGYYYYVEREKDVIRVREENIIPSDIERIAESHPQVLESAAVGIKTLSGDEEVLLALKLRNKVDPSELFSYLDKRLPFYMVPRYLLYVKEMPKTSNQKISRKMVRDIGIVDAIDANLIGFKASRPRIAN